MRLCFWSLASRVSVLGRAVLGLRFFSVLGREPCVLDSTSANGLINLFRPGKILQSMARGEIGCE